MAKETFELTEDAIRRIAAAVHAIERMPVEQDARRRHTFETFLDLGGGGGNVVVIREIPEDNGGKVMVNTVILNDEGEWDVDEDEERYEMPTYPGIPAGWWEYNLLPVGRPTKPKDFVPTQFIGEIEVVTQWFPERPERIRSDEPHTGCRPMGV